MPKEFKKDFDGWIVRKKTIDAMSGTAFVHPREIWWCSVGVSVGAEIDGKNDNYERPVIVMKVYNKETPLVSPIISKQKDDNFHHKINASQIKSYIAQIKQKPGFGPGSADS